MRRWTSAHSPPSQGARTGHLVVPGVSLVSAGPLLYNSILLRYVCCCSVRPALRLLSAPGLKLLFVGPTTQSLFFLFLQLLEPSLLLCHCCSIFWQDNPAEHLSMDHGKPLVSVSLREVTFLSEPLLTASYPSPCLRTWKNEMTSGGDIHRSLLLPSFSGSIYFTQ